MRERPLKQFWDAMKKPRALSSPEWLERSALFANPRVRKGAVSGLQLLVFLMTFGMPLIPVLNKIDSPLVVLLSPLGVPLMVVGIVFAKRLQGARWRQALAGVRPMVYATMLIVMPVALGATVFGPVALIAPTAAIIIAAAVLELGLALAVWFLLNFMFVPLTFYSGSFETGGPLIPDPEILRIIVASVSAVTSLPMLIYVRRIQRVRQQQAGAPRVSGESALGSLAVASAIVLVSVGISLSSSWDVARDIPFMASQQLTSERWRLLPALRLEIEAGFTRDAITSGNDRLGELLVRSAAIADSNIYIFKKDSGIGARAPGQKFTLLIGARKNFGQGSDVYESISIVDKPSAFKGEERRILTEWLDRQDSRDVSRAGELENVRGGSPVSVFIFGPAAGSPAPLGKDAAGRPRYVLSAPRNGKSDLIVVTTATEPDWWMPIGQEPVWQLTAQSPIPGVLYYGVLFLVFTTLLVMTKRRELRLELVKERERARINQEAHDRISNRLSALAVQAETHGARQTEAREFFGQLPLTLRQLVVDLKEVTSRTPIGGTITGAQFKERLTHVCEKRAAEHGFNLRTDIHISERDAVAGHVAETLTLCLEEALGNIAKHAGAENVEVSVAEVGDGTCRMTIEDDGRGFEPPEDFSTLKEQDRKGLAGIENRVKALGGDLRVISGPGNGALYEITWPIRAEGSGSHVGNN